MTLKNDATDVLEQVEQELDREELEWEPSELGDQVVGHLREIVYIDTKNGTVPQLRVENKDGAVILIWCGRTRLKNQLQRAKIQPGDALGVRYLGQQESTNGGKPYHDYKVTVVRVGPRNEEEMFRTEEDLGLTQSAFSDNGDDWTTTSPNTEEAPY